MSDVLSLSKGGRLSLAKVAPTLRKVLVGTGWKIRTTTGAEYDVDLSAILIKADRKVRGQGDFCFYNQPELLGGIVRSSGDALQGGNDDKPLEFIGVDLDRLDAYNAQLVVEGKADEQVTGIIFFVTIHDAERLGQNFGQIRDAFTSFIDAETNKEVIRYDLDEDFSTETAMIFVEIYQRNGWNVKGVGQGYAGGLAALATDHGLRVS